MTFKEPVLGSSWDASGFVSTTVAVGWLLAVGGVPRTSGALAVELVDLVQAVAVVQAGAAGALVRVDLTVNPLVPCRETQHRQHHGTRGDLMHKMLFRSTGLI